MFERKNRLSRNQDFLHIYKHGRRIVSSHFSLFYLNTRKKGLVRCGIVIGKKQSTRASKRNYFKRRVREIMRQHFRRFSPGLDLIIQVRRLDFDRDPTRMRDELAQLLRKLETVEQL